MKFIETHNITQTVCSETAENIFKIDLCRFIAFMLASSDPSGLVQDELEVLYIMQETISLKDIYTFLESEDYVLDIPQEYISMYDSDIFSCISDGILA